MSSIPAEEDPGIDLSWLSIPLMLAQGYAGHYSAQQSKMAGQQALLEAQREAKLKEEDMMNYSRWLGHQRKRIVDTHKKHIMPTMQSQIAAAGVAVSSGGELSRESEISLKRRIADANYGSFTQIKKMRNEQEATLRRGRAAKRAGEVDATSTYFTTGIGITQGAITTWGS